MARGRKGTAGFTALDDFVLAYLALEAGDRPVAMAALRGADLAIRSRQVPIAGELPTPKTEDQGRFEELGASLAEGATK